MNTMYLKTNYNNKMGCRGFIHVDRAPKNPIPASKLGQLREIRTADNSHPPVQMQILALTRFQLGEIIDLLSIPSHGMDAVDFINWWKQENNEDEETEMAVYYYVAPPSNIIVSSSNHSE